MKNRKIHIFLTVVLAFVMSFIVSTCVCSTAIADREDAIEVHTVCFCDLSNFDVASRFFRYASESLVNFSNTGSVTSSVQARTPVRRVSSHSHYSGLADSHFTGHKYFNHSALPFIFLTEPAGNRHYLQFLRRLII